MRFHDVFVPIILILASILQLTSKGNEANPFETQTVKMVAVIVVTLVYGMALCLQISLEEQNSDYSKLMEHYALLAGVLTIIMLLLMLIPLLGWIVLGIWACWFVTVTYCFRGKLKELLDQVADSVKEQVSNLRGGAGVGAGVGGRPTGGRYPCTPHPVTPSATPSPSTTPLPPPICNSVSPTTPPPPTATRVPFPPPLPSPPSTFRPHTEIFLASPNRAK